MHISYNIIKTNFFLWKLKNKLGNATDFLAKQTR